MTWTRSRTLQGKPKPKPKLIIEEPTTSFPLFSPLPAELHVSIIKYAWDAATHACPRHLHADSTFPSDSHVSQTLIPTQHYRMAPADPKVLSLHLVNKFFHAECKVLERRDMIQLPVHTPNGPITKSVLFIPGMDVVHIHIKGWEPTKPTIIPAFEALPQKLRDIVRHVDIDYTGEACTLGFVNHVVWGTKNPGVLHILFSEINGPCLETITASVSKFDTGDLIPLRVCRDYLSFPRKIRGNVVVRVAEVTDLRVR